MVFIKTKIYYQQDGKVSNYYYLEKKHRFEDRVTGFTIYVGKNKSLAKILLKKIRGDEGWRKNKLIKKR